jgi:glyoxylase-like metal-dependent hydrolase (beta-lactamase superfamily II)
MEEQIQIIRVPILPFEMLNAFIVRKGSRAILVDAGVPGCHTKFEKVLRKHDLGIEDVELIVVTHAHIDHAGEAVKLRELCDAPILGHRGDLHHYEGEKLRMCPTGLFGRLFLKTGVPLQRYRAFTPDILLRDNEQLSLASFGLTGQVCSTPGHTAGTVSVALDTGDALVGDLVSSGILLGGILMKGRAKRPPYEDNPHEVALELQKLVDAGQQRFYVGHGRVLPATEVARHAQTLMAL